MARSSFDGFRAEVSKSRTYFNENVGWAVCPGFDERGFAVIVQKARDDKQVMVRVGCRFFTLAYARKHWVSKGRNDSADTRRSAKQILFLIETGLRIADYRCYFRHTKPPKFNATPRKGR